VPRSNTTQSGTPTRSRSRGPARSSTPQRSASNDATAAPIGAPNDPTFDEIAEAAYHRYLKRGGGDGQDFDDWLEAERELKARRSS
jgi:Protein of unknown function (DUF2934)